MTDRGRVAVAFASALVAFAPGSTADDYRWWVEDDHRLEVIGAWSAWIDDVDGDGVQDIAANALMSRRIGIDRHNSNETDRIELLSGADLSRLRTLDGGAETGFGIAIARGGDYDGDGVDELLVAQEHLANGAQGVGRVSAWSATTGSLLREYAVESIADWSGVHLQSLPDLDSDSLAEIVVGFPRTDRGTGALGSIHVLASSDGRVLAEWFGQPTGGIGARPSFKVVHDTDFDGVADLAIAERLSPSSGLHSLVVRVVSGATLVERATRTTTFAVTGEFLGIGSTTDIDLDGTGELIFAFASSVNVWKGSDLRTLKQFSGPAFRARFAAGVGDMTGDGRGDLAIGMEPIVDFSEFTYSVELQLWDGMLGYVADRVVEDDLYYGSDYSFMPGDGAPVDADGDGFADVLYALQAGRDGDIFERQRVAVHSHGAGAEVGRHLDERHVFEMKRAIPFADVDGDGSNDVISREWEQLADASTVEEHLAIRRGSDGAPLVRVKTGGWQSYATTPIAAIPDVDGDGRIDVASLQGTTTGTEVVLRSGVDLRVVQTLPLAWSSGATEFSLAVHATSVNTFELAIGDRYVQGASGLRVGRVELFEFPAATSRWRRDGDATFRELGAALCAIGDVDGDGDHDWAVASSQSLLLLSGADGGTIVARDLPFHSSSDGAALFLVPDDDGDGTSEIGFASGSTSGRLSLFELPDLAPLAAVDFKAIGRRVSVAAVADSNHDGVDELIGGPFAASRCRLLDSRSGELLGELHESSWYDPFDLATAAPFLPGDSHGAARGVVVGVGGQRRGLCLFELPDLYLTVAPRAAGVGELVTADVRGGPPGALVGLFLPLLDEAPLERFLAFDLLGLDGAWRVSESVPPGLSGSSYRLRAYAFGFDGRLSASNDEALAFD
ncbi:MAG: hypothetical protein JNL90_02340 [Planctomycetes bacterium]|nr:hypothetical protein [Planctomycetota bacterium]